MRFRNALPSSAMLQMGDGNKNSHGSLVMFPYVEFTLHKLSIPQAVGDD
jgi:hypothetical protein